MQESATYQLDFAAPCGLNVPYLDIFDLVATSTVWADEAAVEDGAHPNEGGYSLVADTIAAWAEWQRWLTKSVRVTTEQTRTNRPPL